MRLKLLTGKPAPGEPNAFLMRVKFLKNKCATPYWGDPVESLFRYGSGTDEHAEVAEMARVAGYLRHSGGRSKWRFSLEDEYEYVADEMDTGREACIQYFRDNPEPYKRLKDFVDEYC